MRAAYQLALFGLSLAAIVLVCGGCAARSKPVPLQPPPTEIRLTHFAGSAISGPLPQLADVERIEDALAVRFFVLAMENPQPAELAPLGPAARLIHASAGGRAVRPSTRLTVGSRLETTADDALVETITSGQLGRVAPIQELRGALPEAATVSVTLSEPDGIAGSGRYLQVAVSRRAMSDAPPASAPAAPTIELSVTLQEWVKSEPAGDPLVSPNASAEPAPRRRSMDEGDYVPATAPSPQRRALQREIAVVDELSVDPNRRLALTVPFTFTDSEARAIAVFIELTPAADGDPAHALAFAQCAEDLRRSAEAVGAQGSAYPAGGADWPGYESALAAMAHPASRRAAVVYLANQTRATICQDVALVCDDLLLDQLCKQISDRAASQENASRTRQAMGWLLDYSALELLASLLNDNKLPAELSAVLLRQTGEVGRHVSSIEQILEGAGSTEDLDRRLLAENFVFLEDSSPAARVRAYDWLGARQSAPPNYDPLAPNKDRRAALEQALDAMQSAATKGEAP